MNKNIVTTHKGYSIIYTLGTHAGRKVDRYHVEGSDILFVNVGQVKRAIDLFVSFIPAQWLRVKEL